MKITRWDNGETIYEDDSPTMRETLEAAVAARARLTGAVLTDARLTGADLTGADLTGAVLTGAVLTDAVLTDAVLTGTGLTGARLTGAVLTDARLTRAVLDGADLTDADLTGAVLTDARLTGAVLTRADLTGAIFPSPVDPVDYAAAVRAVQDWLTKDRWLSGAWIKTPDGCYSGSCRACLHGAAIYMGGEFGPDICKRLDDAGYTIRWNDEDGRTYEEVMEALASVA